LYAPQPLPHDLSDLVSYQAIPLFAVSAALAIGTRLEAKSNPVGQTAANLHAAPPGETIVVPPVQEPIPTEAAVDIILYYESALFSLFAALLAMSAKECLNIYSLRAALPGNDRNGNRQRRVAVLRDWRFIFLAVKPSILVRMATIFLIAGVCQRLWPISHSIICTLTFLGVPGLACYLWTVGNLR